MKISFIIKLIVLLISVHNMFTVSLSMKYFFRLSFYLFFSYFTINKLTITRAILDIS